MTEYIVSVQRGQNVAKMVRDSLKDLGGIGKHVSPNKTILVKPNLVVERPHSSGAITNPEVLDAILEELQSVSPKEIIVGEGAATHDSTSKAFKVSGVDKVAEKHGARLVDFQKDTYVQVPVPLGKDLDQVQIARTVLQADYIINVPVLKIHCQTKITNALKNLKGCISDKEKKRFHSRNLEQCIADLNTVIPVNLVIVDATLCAFSWEGGGDPVQLDTVLASNNQVAADLVATPLLGYHPQEISHLNLAIKHGLGPEKQEQIKIFNEEQLSEVDFSGMIIEAPRYSVSGLQVVDKGACTSCMGSILAAQRRLKRERKTLPAKVCLGQKLEQEDLNSDKKFVIGIGKCGAKLVGGESAIQGCPPEGWQVYEFLNKYAKK